MGRRVGPRASSHSGKVTGDQPQSASDAEIGRTSHARKGSGGKSTKRIVGASDSPIRVETEDVSIIPLSRKDKTKGKDPFKPRWNLERSPVDEKRRRQESEGKLDMSLESFVNEGIAISRWIGHEVTQSNRKRVLKELKSQYQWKYWQFRKEDHLENYCFSDENDDKRPVAQLDMERRS